MLASALRVVLIIILACLPVAALGQRPGTVNIKPRVATSAPGLPTVTIAVDKRRVPLGEEVTFTLTPASVVRDPRFTVTIDFDDGQQTSTGQTEIVHLYKATGNYTVTVSVAPAGPIAQPSPAPRQVPGVSLSANPTRLLAPGSVTFTAQLSFPYPNIKYRFVFGDGSQATGWQDSARATHPYTSAGTFPAYVDIGIPNKGSVTQVGGRARQLIQVASAPVGTVDLAANPATVRAGDVVNFTARFLSRDPNIVYRFYFGDGTAPGALQSSPQTTHRYASGGTYPAYVEVGRFNNRRFDPITTSAVRQVTVTAIQVNATPTPTPFGPTPTPGVTPTPSAGNLSSPSPGDTALPDSRGSSSSPGAPPGTDRGGLPRLPDSWPWWLIVLVLALIAAYQVGKLILASRLTFRAFTDPGVADIEHTSQPFAIDFEMVLSPNMSDARYELESDEANFIRSERSSNV